MNNDIKNLYRIQKEISILKGISALLDWDESTNMPLAAFYGRSEQVKYIEGLIQEKLTSNILSQTISSLKKQKIRKIDFMIIKELEIYIARKKRIPLSFRKISEKNKVLAQERWREARKHNDYSIFEQSLNKIIELKKEEARLLDPDVPAYDILIRKYEEDFNTERYDKVFAYLKKELLEILSLIKATDIFKNQKKLEINIKKREQEQIIKDIIRQMGITKEKVRISTSLHPFTTRISGNDVRITTRYADPMESFFTVFHEAGHALYDMNLPRRYYHTILYNHASYGLHEAMAIIWENNIGKSMVFWKNYFINYRRYFDKVSKWQDFYNDVNIVKPTKIRVNADEVTYILHIILRYEIEKELIEGRLNAKDLRETWNRKTKELLGIEPKDDNEGILQDIHWASSDFGYFPSYAIGMIYACQISRQMFKEIPDAQQMIARQEFAPFIEWLKNHIYSKGKTRSAEHIVKNAAGQGLNPKIFIEYLRDKYSRIYGF